MDALAEELKSLVEQGITDPTTGLVYRFVILGIKGDMPYLQKVAKLKRSWNTTVKRGSARSAPKGVCHLCLAGTDSYPCEDTTDNPGWAVTIGVQVPWDTRCGFLRLLPHDRNHPGSYLKADLWHCVHLGVGKSFVASTLQLLLEKVPCTNNDDRFDWLTNHYQAWCRSVKSSCYVSKISAYLVSYNDAAGAVGSWSKGSLTTNLMKWLVVVVGDLVGDADPGLLPRCRQAAMQMNAALSHLYNAPLFLEAEECQYVWTRGMFFLQSYSYLAGKCFGMSRPHLFPLYPKLHACHHCWLQIRTDQSLCGFSLNPMTASCQMDEDCIGRVSRVSRRVSVRTVTLRTLQRHLITCCAVWRDAGLVKWFDVLVCWKSCGFESLH